jgi:GntR family histidine utilization transcriptional repressor
VNRALRELASSGRLERRRKAGTRVPLNPIRKATFEIPIIREDIVARGLTYSYRLILQRDEVATSQLLLRLALPRDSVMQRVLALHLADDAPFCIEDRWINPAAVPEFRSADLTKVSANEWLIQNAGFSAGDIAFGAIEADEYSARLLNCAVGSALFTNDRTTFAGEVAVTSVRLIYAPGYQMHARI